MNAIEILEAWQAEWGGREQCRYHIHAPDEFLDRFAIELEHDIHATVHRFHKDCAVAAQRAVDAFREKLNPASSPNQ